MLCNQLKALSKESSLLKMHVILIEIANMWTTRLLRARSALSNLILADSWLGAVRKKKLTQSAGQQGVAQCRHFFGQEEGVIQMRTSVLFVAKTNIKFFKIYSVSTWTWTGEEERDW